MDGNGDVSSRESCGDHMVAWGRLGDSTVRFGILSSRSLAWGVSSAPRYRLRLILVHYLAGKAIRATILHYLDPPKFMFDALIDFDFYATVRVTISGDYFFCLLPSIF